MYNETKQKDKFRLSRPFVTDEGLSLQIGFTWHSINHCDFVFPSIATWKRIKLIKYKTIQWLYKKLYSDQQLGDDGSVARAQTDTEKK